MRYRCSNNHIFTSETEPRQCQHAGCQSRLITPLAMAERREAALGWTRVLLTALIVLALADLAYGLVILGQAKHNAQRGDTLKSMQAEGRKLSDDILILQTNPLL
jgi:hypothetical protein